MRQEPRKLCERCNAAPVSAKGNRYCKECRKQVLKELKDTGYLTGVTQPTYRAPEKRELTHETKFGTDH